MIRTWLATLLISVALTLFAQDRPRIGVPLFDFKEENKLNLDNHVTEVVIDLLQKSGRYTVVDMTSEDQRKAALDRAAENYKAENWLDAHKGLNAEIILGGEITSIKFVRNASTTQPGYRAAITMTLKLIAVETGAIMATEHFSSTKSELRLTPETALSSALESIREEVLAFFRNHVRQQFAVVKFNEIKREKVNTLTVEVPPNLGFNKGHQLRIVHLEDLGGGRIVPQIIGAITLGDHISGNFWMASVRKGGDLLFQYRDRLNTIRCAE
jgi:hypothetical protein